MVSDITKFDSDHSLSHYQSHLRDKG